MITESIFITGDGNTIYIQPKSSLKYFECFGWREATSEEVEKYYDRLNALHEQVTKQVNEIAEVMDKTQKGKNERN